MEEIILKLIKNKYDDDGTENQEVITKKLVVKRDYLNAERLQKEFGNIEGSNTLYIAPYLVLNEYQEIEIIDSIKNKYIVTNIKHLKNHTLLYSSKTGKVK